MKTHLLVIGLVSLCLHSGAYALSPNQFTSLEYHVNTGLASTLPYAADQLTPDFTKAFGFIALEDELSIKLVTFIDTPNRDFNAKHINIRVRENVTTPRKSKITIKLRDDNPEAFGELSGYKKAEVDYTEGKAAYSVSYDLPYSPNDIDIQHVNIATVFDIIKRNQAMWNIVSDIYNQHKQDLIQTEVMRTHAWEGFVKDKRFNDVEMEFQIWTPYYRKPRITFAEFSFKGSTGDKARLDEAYQYVDQQVKAVGFDSGHQGSKTNSTFTITEAFNQ